MRAAALAAAVIAAFIGVMYVRFAGDTVPAPPTPRPYAAGQPTCIVFRPASSEERGEGAQPTPCGELRVDFELGIFPPTPPVPTPVQVVAPLDLFARVVNTDGTCLNIRAEPGSAGQVLACEADGMLLRDLGQTAKADAVMWLRVATPAGVEGWASTQYLER